MITPKVLLQITIIKQNRENLKMNIDVTEKTQEEHKMARVALLA